MATVLNRTKKNATPNRARKLPLFHPESPVMLDDNRGGDVCRQIHPEHKRTVAALRELHSLCRARIDRILGLLPDDGGGVTVTLDPSKGALSLLDPENAWKPGKRRFVQLLEKDRVLIIGISLSGFCGNIPNKADSMGTGLGQLLVEQMRAFAATLNANADIIARDMEANPQEWSPMPTLGEFMAKKGGKA